MPLLDISPTLPLHADMIRHDAFALPDTLITLAIISLLLLPLFRAIAVIYISRLPRVVTSLPL